MSNINVGTMVVISNDAPGNAQGESGWISRVTEDNTAVIELRNFGGTVEVAMEHVSLAKEGFVWPKGTQAELSVYDEDHPQRIPAEGYFSGNVQRDINDVRTGNQYANLWLLIDSLKNLEDEEVRAGFHTWLWAIESILGEQSCKRVGETVCRLMNFTIEEGEELMNGAYRIHEARQYGLTEEATWEEIRDARNRTHELEMSRMHTNRSPQPHNKPMVLDEVPETIGDLAISLGSFRSFGTAVPLINAINDAVSAGEVTRDEKLTIGNLDKILQQYWDNNDPGRGKSDGTDPMIALMGAMADSMSGETHNPFASAEDLIRDLQNRIGD